MRKVVLAAVAISLCVTAPATASQHGPIKSSCSGTKLKTRVLKDDRGTRVGRVELWYSAANGGTNCVITYNGTSGKRNMEAFLKVDDDGDRASADEDDRFAWDRDPYESYAGAVYWPRTNGKCVQWGGYVQVGMLYHGFKSRWVFCT